MSGRDPAAAVQGHRLFAVEAEELSRLPGDSSAASATAHKPDRTADDGDARGTNGTAQSPPSRSPLNNKRKDSDGNDHPVHGAARPGADGARNGRLDVGHTALSKRRPPVAKPHTTCTLCGRVGRAETFIFSRSTELHYCSSFRSCDRRRGVEAA